jgi:predicted nucleotidyltransferase component of viral defense system
MLRTETVEESTLELLRNLQTQKFLNDFILVGGTALSLQLGHRMSVDLDFFTLVDFDCNLLIEQIS